jgi:hypothetical protein
MVSLIKGRMQIKSDNRVLGRMLGTKRDKVRRGWRKLCNEELRNLYSAPNVTRMIKSRRMRLVRYVTDTEEMTNMYNWFQSLKARDNSV